MRRWPSWVSGWMNVCKDGWMGVGGGWCGREQLLGDVPALLLWWWWWWLGAWWAINAAADQWHTERPPGTWNTAGKWLQGFGVGVGEVHESGAVNEIKMHQNEKKKKQLSIHQELAHSPLIGRDCRFTILTQLQEITDHKALRNISHSNETLLSKNTVRGTAHTQRISVVAPHGTNLHKQTPRDGAWNRNQPILQPRFISVSILTSLSRCVVSHDVTNQYWAHFLCQSHYKIQCFIYKTLSRVRPLTQFLVPQPFLASCYLT